MLIGLGGGAASSQGSGAGEAELDFASVQRGNAEMQRRAQEVIDACWALGERTPIAAIHDIGAGGLSNAVPEIVDHSGCGATIELRAIPNDEPGMSPMELWCNESQERYMLTIEAGDLPRFAAICERERAPYAVLGELTGNREPASHRVVGQLMEDGAAGLLAPSFAHGATPHDHNLILWRWGKDLPHRVDVHDPSGRLPKNQLSWD